MKEQVFLIDGMRCAACVSAVEKALSRLDGVSNVSVNLTSANAFVVYDENIVDADKMKVAVSNAGFRLVEDANKNGEYEKLKKDERKAEKKRLVAALVFGTILLVFSMGHMLGMPLPAILDMHENPANFAAVQFVLCLPLLICGFDIYKNGFSSAVHRAPGMDTLVALGSFSSFAYSCYSLVMIFLGHGEYVHNLYFEGAGMILAFIMLGRYLESSRRAKTGDAIAKLLSLSPDTALLETSDGIREVPSETLRVGDIAVIKPGMSIPVDGDVISGESTVNEAMLTGESLPVDKVKGSGVFAGTINNGGYLRIRCTRVPSESAVAKIVAAVEQAQSTKAPIARIANVIAGKFVPAVLIIALASAVIWLAVGQTPAFAIKIFVSILVIACPCALGLATPTALTVSMGVGAQNGLLFKNAETLENMSRIDTVLFDKTGTVTEGKLSVTELFCRDGADSNTVLSYLLTAENQSEHPVAAAIVKYAVENGAQETETERFSSVTGKGISCTVGGKNLLCGNRRLMDENAVDTGCVSDKYNEFVSKGMTAVFLAVEGKVLAVVGVSDVIRTDAKTTVERLRSRGIKCVMLTGDNDVAARYIAQAAGIDTVYSELLPSDKTAIVDDFKAQGRKVAMVGDGINDAPALVGADIGVAVEAAADIAIDCADIVLINSNVSRVADAVDLSVKTMRVVRQNLFWAFIYNLICIPVAAGVLTVFGGPLLNPMVAAAAMSLSSITVVGNSLRLAKGLRPGFKK